MLHSVLGKMNQVNKIVCSRNRYITINRANECSAKYINKKKVTSSLELIRSNYNKHKTQFSSQAALSTYTVDLLQNVGKVVVQDRFFSLQVEMFAVPLLFPRLHFLLCRV